MTRTPPATPSPEVDYPLLVVQRILSKNGFVCKNDTGNPVQQMCDTIAPYLAQGAVRVDLEKCAQAMADIIEGKGGDASIYKYAVKSVILSLKQQNPDKEFIYE